MGTRVALTGGIAAGKSMVAARMGELGAILVDSDVLARQVVEPGTDGLAAVVARFGRGVLRDDGTLDRAALGALVFTDPGARADLEAITHPRVRAARQAILDGAAPDAVVVAVIPLLVETGQQGAYDQVVVVDVPEAVQVARLVARDGLTTEQAWARLHAQAPREARLGAADVVIDNSGTPADTRAQVDAWWRAIPPRVREVAQLAAIVDSARS